MERCEDINLLTKGVNNNPTLFFTTVTDNGEIDDNDRVSLTDTRDLCWSGSIGKPLDQYLIQYTHVYIYIPNTWVW